VSDHGLTGALGNVYDLSLETVNGRQVVRARCVHPHSGLRITLTFPVDGGVDLEQFKGRLVRMAAKRIANSSGTA